MDVPDEKDNDSGSGAVVVVVAVLVVRRRTVITLCCVVSEADLFRPMIHTLHPFLISPSLSCSLADLVVLGLSCCRHEVLY